MGCRPNRPAIRWAWWSGGIRLPLFFHVVLYLPCAVGAHGPDLLIRLVFAVLGGNTSPSVGMLEPVCNWALLLECAMTLAHWAICLDLCPSVLGAGGILHRRAIAF